jgi:hypothetical protein
MEGDDDGEKGGYCKPPKHTQFKKGQSGNPSGKPKKVLTHTEIAARELDRRMTITEDGKKKRLSKREVIHKAIIQKAMKGDLKAIKMLIELDQAKSLGDQAEELMKVTLVFPEEDERRRQKAEEERQKRLESGE